VVALRYEQEFMNDTDIDIDIDQLEMKVRWRRVRPFATSYARGDDSTPMPYVDERVRQEGRSLCAVNTTTGGTQEE
jgi:hypothetical protein